MQPRQHELRKVVYAVHHAVVSLSDEVDGAEQELRVVASVVQASEALEHVRIRTAAEDVVQGCGQLVDGRRRSDPVFIRNERHALRDHASLQDVVGQLHKRLRKLIAVLVYALLPIHTERIDERGSHRDDQYGQPIHPVTYLSFQATRSSPRRYAVLPRCKGDPVEVFCTKRASPTWKLARPQLFRRCRSRRRQRYAKCSFHRRPASTGSSR